MAYESNLTEREKVRRDKLASYFFDLSKLSFAGLVIGIILPLLTDTGNLRQWAAVFFGVVLMTATSALLANKLLKY